MGNEKAGSPPELNLGHLACAASALKPGVTVSYIQLPATASPFTFICCVGKENVASFPDHLGFDHYTIHTVSNQKLEGEEAWECG